VGDGPYISILVIGVVIVLVDGQLILRNSPGYLAAVYNEPKRARQVAALVTVLFHLVMLGVVALVSSIALSPDAGLRSVLARTGMILILTAVGHGVTIGVLSRLRQQQLDTDVLEDQIEHHRDQHSGQPGHAPGGEPPVDRPGI
jgi:protein-S-isoprenylcysteine O-methyltransferase Ste14